MKFRVIGIIMALTTFIAAGDNGEMTQRRLASYTPYDMYLNNFYTVYNRPEGDKQLSLNKIKEILKEVNAINYEEKVYNTSPSMATYTSPGENDQASAYAPKLPEQTLASGKGDCKDKALLLYDKLRRIGSVRMEYVLGGLAGLDSNTWHCWLYIYVDNTTYILDPTCNSDIVTNNNNYTPCYAFDGINKFVYGRD